MNPQWAPVLRCAFLEYSLCTRRNILSIMKVQYFLTLKLSNFEFFFSLHFFVAFLGPLRCKIYAYWQSMMTTIACSVWHSSCSVPAEKERSEIGWRRTGWYIYGKGSSRAGGTWNDSSVSVAIYTNAIRCHVPIFIFHWLSANNKNEIPATAEKHKKKNTKRPESRIKIKKLHMARQ